MFNFELTNEVIYLPSLLADRWKDVAEFKKAKNVQDVVNIINSIMKGLDCYVDLHDFIYPFGDYNKVVIDFKKSLGKKTELVIYDFELRADETIYRNNTNIVDFFKKNIVDFFKKIWKTTETGFNYRVYYSEEVDMWLLSIEGIRTPHDTKISLHNVYFMLDDIKVFEQKHNLLLTDNDTNNQKPKEIIKEVIKEIEKPQKQQPINQDDNYKYIEALKPYNDIILAFDSEYQEYKDKTKANSIDSWLKTNYPAPNYSRDEHRVLKKLIKAHYKLKK